MDTQHGYEPTEEYQGSECRTVIVPEDKLEAAACPKCGEGNVLNGFWHRCPECSEWARLFFELVRTRP